MPMLPDAHIEPGQPVVKAVRPYRAHFPIAGKTFPISTPEIFMECYCVARN